MNKNIILFTVLVVIIILGAFFVFSSEDDDLSSPVVYEISSTRDDIGEDSKKELMQGSEEEMKDEGVLEEDKIMNDEMAEEDDHGDEGLSMEEDGEIMEETSEGQWNIDITDGGYEPQVLEIKAGYTVTWINVGSRPNWPATDPHPVHTRYPEEGGCINSAFDACKGLETGESFSFTFNEIGSWDYHDHSAPGLTGTIVVSK